MNIRSSSITADILNYISDGKVHTMKQIANELEIHINTVQRHIQSLSYRYNIETFCGGINRGGVQLIPEPKVSVERLTSDDLQLIISKLSSLQEDNPRVKAFINKLSTQKEIKERNLWIRKN